MLSQPGSILRSTPIERRSMPRLSTSDTPARIAWKQEGLRVCKAPARLIDISENGASLFATRPAERGEVLWLGIASLPWEWVKATIRGTFPDGPRWRFHIAFCEPCPVGLLEEAIGPSARNQDVPSFRILWDNDDDDDDDIEENTCFIIHLL
jgi:hypothetical protein